MKQYSLIKSLLVVTLLATGGVLTAQSVGADQRLDSNPKLSIKYISETTLLNSADAHHQARADERISLNEIVEVNGITLIPTKFFVELMGEDFAHLDRTYSTYLITETYSKVLYAALNEL